MDLDNARNLLLRRLEPAERAELRRHAVEQRLDFKQTLHRQGERVTHIYFVESGVVSIVTEFAGGAAIETGTVGHEGFVGTSAVLGVAASPSRTLCQIPGHGIAIPVALVEQGRRAASGWFHVLLRYTHFVSAMATQSAACNRMHTVDMRMSRWLLMTHDRVEADEFPLTQEFLSQMLGVARPTVNTAGATLQRAGFISYTRGRITILDRDGLEGASCECYRRIQEMHAESMNGAPLQPVRRSGPRKASAREPAATRGTTASTSRKRGGRRR